MNIKLEVCRECLLIETCQHNYDYECKKVSVAIFIKLLEGNK